jgi:hypothetical protein
MLFSMHLNMVTQRINMAAEARMAFHQRMHQLDQEGYPTSGISTTPHFERACTYATYGGVPGFVYKIDRQLLDGNGVKQWLVEQFVVQPSIPEDDEVILVANDFGALPDSIVVEIVPVG